MNSEYASILKRLEDEQKALEVAEKDLRRQVEEEIRRVLRHNIWEIRKTNEAH